MNTVFIRAIEAPTDDKAEVLRRAACASSAVRFERELSAFATVPGSPFAYWVSKRMLDIFQEFPAFNAGARVATVGLQSSDDFRFLRLWFEPRAGAAYLPFAKGGAFSPFYADLYVSIMWDRDGHEVKAFAETTPGSKHWSRNIRSAEHYLRPGLTWPIKNRGPFKPRCLPARCVFAHVGPCAFVDSDSARELLANQALMSSGIFTSLVRVMAGWNYEVGVVQRTPFPVLGEPELERLARLARRGWSLKRAFDSTNESSHAFLLPSCLSEKMTGFSSAVSRRELGEIECQIDEEACLLYGLGEKDRIVPEGLVEGENPREAGAEGEVDGGDSDEEFDEGSTSNAFNSWLVGVAFGRFDPRLATGERAIPPEPEPFDPLPSRSPGMYPEGEEPADRPDILVDDEGHADDLAARAAAVAERVKVEVPENLRGWLAKEFFPLHIKMYSKSRRKAPIYWQLGTPSASYSVWLYLHGFGKDTLFRVQNDYATPKLAHEERRLEALRSELRDSSTAAQRKELAAQQALVEELRAFLEEVKRVAPLWKPNLDDGVIINFAPLWRLVPQHKPWQKELKVTWDVLCEGKYDWAHLAMHLWPERVVPKCATDRSLAIAHGLEEVFWVEGTGKEAGKWSARTTPTRPIDELIQERTSPAVKAALKSLLAAPVASGTAKKAKKGKAHA